MSIPSTAAATEHRRALARQPAAADTDETLLSRADDEHLGLVLILAHAPSGLSSPTVTLKDDNGELGTFAIEPGDTTRLLVPALPAVIDGDLVWQASSTGVTINAWATREPA